MATLLKKIFSVYDSIRVIDKAEATTQRDIARMRKELERRDAQIERGWRASS